MRKRDSTEPLICSRCGSQQECPYELSRSSFAQQPFVCDNCRCIDCSIVLNIECECGQRHADVSLENSRVCAECMLIRERVSNLDPDLLKLRNADINEQEPVYEIRLTAKIIQSIVDTCDRIEFHTEADSGLQKALRNIQIGENITTSE